MRCSVIGCHSINGKGKNITFGMLPKDKGRRTQWLILINRPKWNPKVAAVCERHFSETCWETTREDGKRKLKRTAAPSLHLGRQKETLYSKFSIEYQNRKKRREKGQNKEDKEDKEDQCQIQNFNLKEDNDDDNEGHIQFIDCYATLPDMPIETSNS